MAEEHKHGEMDITVQEKTFDNFMSWTVWVCMAVIVVLIGLALFAS